MRSIPTVVVGAALLALALALVQQPAHAQTCAGLSETACYAEALCHFDPAQSACADGAATTCFQLYRDTAKCTGSLDGRTCAVNGFNGQCMASTAPPCSTHDADANKCTMRRDCKPGVEPSTCVVATDKCGQYAAEPSSDACMTAGCFYDGFVPAAMGGGKCFSSLMEVNTFYAPTCSFWSHYQTGDACKMHGCAWASGLCFAVSNGPVVDTTDRVSSQWTFNLAEAAITEFPYLTGKVVIPIEQYFNPAEPMHHVLVIGTPPAVGGPPLTPSMCNTLAAAMPAFGISQPRVDPFFPGGNTQLTSQFTVAAATTKNLTYTDEQLEPVARLAVYQTIGENDVGRTSASIIQRVEIPNTLPGTVNVELHTKFDVRAMKACGATETPRDDHTEYVTPLTLYVRQGDNTAQATISITSRVYTHGVVQVGATQINEMKAFMSARDTAVDAPVDTKKKRVWTVRLAFTVSDPTKIVGLYALEHAMMTPDGNPAAQGSPVNCFGTHPTALRAPVACPGGTCVTEIDFETDYISTDVSGDSLNMCGFRDRDAHIVDMGLDGADPIPYPASLNYRHDFFILPYQWNVGDTLVDSNYPSAEYVGRDATMTVGDLVGVTLDFPTSLSVGDLKTKLRVRCGLLPTPDAAFEDMLHTFDTGDDATVPRPDDIDTTGFDGSVVDLRNQQLNDETVLTVACYLVDPNHRRDLWMNLDVTGEAEGQPPRLQLSTLTAMGKPIEGVTPLSWKQLSPLAVRVPRKLPGVHGKATNDVRGVDSLSVPVPQLRNLRYAEGYALKMYQYVDIPSDEVTGSGSGGIINARRLLQAQQEAYSATQAFAQNLAILFGPGGNTTKSAILLSNLGSPASSAGIGVGVVLGATTGGALLVNGALLALGVL